MFTKIQESVAGAKTYILAVIIVLCVLVEKVLGMDIPGFDPGQNWLEYIMGALGLSALRAGVAKSGP
jgi:hypothetical protein